MNGLFFTGTDTGVGKTHVVAEVAWLLRRQGRPVGVCKPVATGAACLEDCGDALRLAEAVDLREPLDRVTPYLFTEPVAPAVAAQLHGRALSIGDLAAAVRSRSLPGEALLVEGVGGLLCPLTERETVAELAAALELPVIIVARRSLGTLNHTLMTVEVALGRGLRVAGVVISETTPPEGLAEQTNVQQLRRRLAVPVLAVAFHQSGSAREADSGLAAVDWWRLCHATANELQGVTARPGIE
ncbi:MAG: dethiobiotin synthase [Gemmataceae bacterium]|nr:dethiobiotin synthase [Gemmataceae bacterium]